MYKVINFAVVMLIVLAIGGCAGSITTPSRGGEEYGRPQHGGMPYGEGMRMPRQAPMPRGQMTEGQRRPPQGELVPHGTCTAPGQQGCFDLMVMNVAFNPNDPHMTSITHPYSSQEERRDRVENFGPAMWDGFKSGHVQAGPPRTFLVFLWDIQPTGIPSGYRVEGDGRGNHRTTRERMFDVTSVIRAPVMAGEMGAQGKPDRVFRITARGDNPIAATFQIPWGMVTPSTYILVCAEDSTGIVYPHKGNGLWITAPTLNFLKDKGAVGSKMAFLFGGGAMAQGGY